ncbi:peptidoglycan DD-metalloendopeptidase family protein [Pelagovum pacificum]|uniref:LysM peptidoglycan-binding domain-containing protein n=1 Tax=Pelagovum pacificum TaxID=2588711 RepID=A0A5C5GD81_9RHOB|nr:peptidoglycan DD-metalloendopeptidase family protein [Pelagovum pacificum]QQA44106.1 peptidoglycan DD-metalloendopeptidase family protein [Pelagovum pacificum]TNY32765.1 LysM peptidoglycan-binding domain-containing protein [Pelagovum pacificum]
MATRAFPTAGRLIAASGLLGLVAACSNGQFDPDLRNLGNGFDTSEAASADYAARPAADERGVITYPNTQVVVARQGDTVTSVAARLGLEAESLARFNGVELQAPLRAGEVLALPARVDAGNSLQAPGQVNVTELASAAIDRAGGATSSTTQVRPAAPAGAEPLRHQVQRGETIYTISRLYNVPVRGIADWNGLGADLAVREGQQLLIPQGGAAAPAEPATDAVAVTTIPGEGSPTPLPPSSSAPLPDEDPMPVTSNDTAEAEDAPAPPPAPDLGEQRTTAPSSDAPLIMPVDGSIIREFARGRNEGIDILSSPGAPVRAAAAGTVAAITQDTDGASIVVVRHPDNLLTVYVNLTDLEVQKDQSVSQGQTLARIPNGDPAYLHFETREGLQSVDPNGYLP